MQIASSIDKALEFTTRSWCRYDFGIWVETHRILQPSYERISWKTWSRFFIFLLSWTNTILFSLCTMPSLSLEREPVCSDLPTIGLQNIVPLLPIIVSGSSRRDMLGWMIASKVSNPSTGNVEVLKFNSYSRIQNRFISGRSEIAFKMPRNG